MRNKALFVMVVMMILLTVSVVSVFAADGYEVTVLWTSDIGGGNYVCRVYAGDTEDAKRRGEELTRYEYDKQPGFRIISSSARKK
jgi:hypothetical protein